MLSPQALVGALLLSAVPSALAETCQAPINHPGEPYSYVQPRNTTILTDGHSSAFLPSPNMTGNGGWEAALVKAKKFVNKPTLEEKSWMATGQPGPCVGNVLPIPRLNFTGLCLQNGPQGNAMAKEHKAKGSHVILGPIGGPLGRSPYDSPTWEGFAADPYLTGVCTEETINGMQNAGIQSNAKHFIVNEQETQRNPSYAPDANETTYIQDSVSANINDSTLHEIYMWPFANAVHAKVASAMCSYNRVNGSHSCQNSCLLNHLLKGELGFQGYVMSDWGATHSGVASVKSGMDMTMPGGFTLYGEEWTEGSFLGKNLTLAVRNRTVEVSRLNHMIVRIMTPYFWLGQEKNYPSVDASVGPLNVDSAPDTWLYDWKFTGETNRDVRTNHSAMIRERGASSTVLLKNERNALPLRKPRNSVIAGNDAGPLTQVPNLQADFEYGHLAGSSGSEELEPPLWIPQQPDVCLVFLKSFAAEGKDRTSLNLDWNGNAVVESVANVCNNTVVVTNSGGINVMPFADNPNVTAILAQHYAGEESGNAIADVLYGDVNPSGKLPYVIAYNETDYNAPLTTGVETNGTWDWQSWFDEELEVGYRYFDANNISNIKAKSSVPSNLTALPVKQATQPGGNPALWDTVVTLEAEVSNTGDVDGFAVPQLYIEFPASTPAGTPPSQLRGFDKVHLTAGEKKTAKFDLMRRDFIYWDVTAQDWRIPIGSFTFKAGFSSRDFHSKKTVTLIKA
ncbi:hypothetical protein N7508_010853 [Penicillium antarcticum]|uniref:uncharacterized protein n=1 Tax=Penicillium antarcticum TaxID=416450 RepID=UPI00238A0872|nr:uncharacterized protein N7508_010853 [Penicillium antarcticum]KAJ5296032.1 hypothetical protein N7508_010853 [Penicillium antarcticum]